MNVGVFCVYYDARMLYCNAGDRSLDKGPRVEKCGDNRVPVCNRMSFYCTEMRGHVNSGSNSW